jgi:ABC-2 type transport system permease protein
MSLSPARALTVKGFLTMRENMFRLFDVTLWPVLFFLSLAFLSTFLSANETAFAVVVFGSIGWRVLYHFSLEAHQLYIDDYWASASEHLMISAVRTRDFLFSGGVLGLAKSVFISAILYLLALSVFRVPAIEPVTFLVALGILAVFGLSLTLVFLGTDYYFGERGFSAAFYVSDVVSVLSGVFYPLALLPEPMRLLAQLLPPTHAFSLIKSAYGLESFNPALAALTLAGWGVLALAVNRWLYEQARRKGRLLKLK